MSLFSVCNWWRAQCADLEPNYDCSSLLCARFGLEANEKDYVVVGSHTGHLSIFYATLLEVERDGFKPTDLLLETRLAAPILGLHAGRFSGHARNENTNQLAVLHPNSVAIFNLNAVGGVAEHGAQLALHQLAEYKFQRVAFGFCKGHFGKIKGREFFCIIHLDGTLTFYEQDGISYECQFPGHRALPSPVVYCERTDSFIRFSATWRLECYTYQDLSHSSINKSQYQPTWSVCIGEGILDMCCVQTMEDTAAIVILGERNFICLNDDGQVRFILKLDYAPKCFCAFVVGYYWEPNARLITAVVSETAKFYIYENANIIWAAQASDAAAPVAIQRSNVSGLPGGIVTLGETGQVRIGYLGSDPFVFKVPLQSGEEITFAQAHKELVQLEEEIRAAIDVQDGLAINERAYDDVRISFSINPAVSEDSDALLLDVPADVAMKELPVSTGSLKFKSKVDLNELQIVINTPAGVRCSQDTATYTDVGAGTAQLLELEFYIAELLHVHSARVEVVVSFISAKGIPRVTQHYAHLPLAMFFKARQPQKTAAIKLTYNITSRSLSPKLATFFPEFVTWESDVQALGLVLLCPADGKAQEVVTIVAGKNSSRLRIQSDSLEALPMILERLVQVVLEHDAQSNDASQDAKTRKSKGLANPRVLSVMASPSLPAPEILHRIDLHRETQENIRKQTVELDGLWLQFKTLQRKLQEKSDDEPKETLVMQIEENYDRLIAEGDKLMEMRKDEQRQSCDLTCAIAVASLIISCLNMEEKVVNVVLSVLCTPIEDWTELSWEEAMSPGIDMLHHYGPINRVKTAAPANHVVDMATSTAEQFDYNRFRRHFATLFERLVRLASTEEPIPAAPTTEPSKRNALAKDVNAAVIPNPVLGGAVGKLHAAKRTTLEAVEDDDEGECDEVDGEDLRTLGYRKDYGVPKNAAQSSEHAPAASSVAMTSDWVNEQYELPSAEELFNDLGIWW